MIYQWIDEATDLLRKLHGEGLSFTDIAYEMNRALRHGTVTRNGCIGKAHRIGLVSTNTKHAPKPYKPRTGEDTKLIDLTGHRFGQWTVRRRAKGGSASRRVHWLCVCTCGTERSVCSADLRRGKSSGCGCKQGDKGAAKRRANAAVPPHPFEPKRKPLEEQVAEIVFAAGPEGLRFMEQREGHCKWPISAETDFESFRVCGCLCKMTQPYCDEHTAKATQPLRPRPPRDPAPMRRNTSEMYFKDWA